jgi:hypothetical protein
MMALVPSAQGAADKPIRQDFDGDGHVDTLTIADDRGSGFWSTERCVQDGASHRRACVTVTASAYGMFEAIDETSPKPALPAKLRDELRRPQCVPASKRDPSHGVMWALAQPEPSGERVTLAPRMPTAAGVPKGAPAICLSHTQARSLRGGFGWDAQGAAGQAPTPGRTILFPKTRPPALVLSSGRWRVYQLTGAVALYHSGTKRHRWLPSFADGGDEGFKIDRHARFADFRRTAGGFTFRVNRSSQPATSVSVRFPAP